ncbi:MAG: nuclear transport factor 2 family protein [Woeseia sp.]
MSSVTRLSLALVIGSILILSSCGKQDNSLDTANTNDQDNLAIARSMYATLLAGDMAGAYALMAGDITWTYYGGEGQIPFSGVYTGHAGIERFFADYGAVATPLGMEIESYSASGDTIFVKGIEKARINATGKEYAAPWVHVIKIKDKKIVSYEEHIDSALVAAAFE